MHSLVGMFIGSNREKSIIDIAYIGKITNFILNQNYSSNCKAMDDQAERYDFKSGLILFPLSLLIETYYGYVLSLSS